MKGSYISVTRDSTHCDSVIEQITAMASKDSISDEELKAFTLENVIPQNIKSYQ